MRIQCEYCDGYLQDTDETCPNCAAVNKYLKRSADGIPKTIEELIAFAEAKKLPLAQMRFFLGQDYRGARAFGIYKNAEGLVTVYKNKSNGQRVIRYEGTDEAYAVNEIYQKMKTEIVEQRAHQANKSRKITYGSNYRSNPTYRQTRSESVNTTKHSGVFTAIMIIIIICLIIYGMFVFMASWNTFNYGGSGGNYGGSSWHYDYSDDDDDDSGWDNNDYDSGWDDDWDSDWDDDDWDWDSDWDDSYSDWDSDW